MRRFLGFILLTTMVQAAEAQRLLNLDSCRALALHNNKQLSISRVKQEVAANVRKSARTKYLPHVSALGGYEFTSKEMSILNDEQKEALGGLGTNLTGTLQSQLAPFVQHLPADLQQQLGVEMKPLGWKIWHRQDYWEQA